MQALSVVCTHWPRTGEGVNVAWNEGATFPTVGNEPSCTVNVRAVVHSLFFASLSLLQLVTHANTLAAPRLVASAVVPLSDVFASRPGSVIQKRVQLAYPSGVDGGVVTLLFMPSPQQPTQYAPPPQMQVQGAPPQQMAYQQPPPQQQMSYQQPPPHQQQPQVVMVQPPQQPQVVYVQGQPQYGYNNGYGGGGYGGYGGGYSNMGMGMGVGGGLLGGLLLGEALEGGRGYGGYGGYGGWGGGYGGFGHHHHGGFGGGFGSMHGGHGYR